VEILIVAAFITYALMLLSIGSFFSIKAKSSSSFILGGRSTNYWVTAVALQASDMSHWIFLGLPAVVYEFGLIKFWEILGLVVFMFLNWHFVAPKIRVATEKLQTITLFSYFEKKFNDRSGTIRTLSAVIAVIFFTFYISSGIVAMGRLFENAFGITYEIGASIGLSVTVIYTLVGGFVAVAWCDFFQGLFALAMIILVPMIAYTGIGGWKSIVTAAEVKNVSLNIMPKSIWQLASLFFIWGPGYFGQPHLLSFFMGIKDPKNIKYAKLIGFAWQTIALSSATLIGLLGLVYFNNVNSEIIYILLTKLLFHPFVAGFVLCAIVAATLSTLDSHILTAGTTIAQDIYKKIFNHQASSKKILWISRIGSLFVSLSALYIAYGGSNTVYNLINYGWSGMGSAFGPLVILSLYSNKITKQGALAGIITGAITSLTWPYFETEVPILIPGFILSYLAIYLISHIPKRTT